MLKLLRFKLMNRFPFVPAQLHSAVLQPLSQAGSKGYSDKTKPSFPLALPPSLLHNNIYKIAIKTGGDSKTVSVKGTQVIKYQALNPPCNTNSLPAHVFACFKASLKAELHPACSLGSQPHAGCGMSKGVPEALLLHPDNVSLHWALLRPAWHSLQGPFGSGHIHLDCPQLPREQGGSSRHCPELLRAKREVRATEVTAEAQATRAMGLAPWQAGFGTVCASSRKPESFFFLCCCWQEEFSKDNLVCSISQQTAAAGDGSRWKVHLPSDASQSLPYIPTSTKRQLRITGKHQPPGMS